MSTSVKIFIFAALFISNALANSMEAKQDIIGAEKGELAKLAARTDLTVKEFLGFVSVIDDKCEKEKTPEKKEALCALYYEMFKIEELFVENRNDPTWEQCQQTGLTSDALSTDDIVRSHVNTIASKLCPKK
jgi:hypothetical protein